MRVGPAFASVLEGLTRAERSLDAAASDVVRTTTRDPVPATRAADEPAELASLRGDLAGPLVQMIAAQRAFGASLAVMRADRDMQRAVLDMVR